MEDIFIVEIDNGGPSDGEWHVKLLTPEAQGRLKAKVYKHKRKLSEDEKAVAFLRQLMHTMIIGGKLKNGREITREVIDRIFDVDLELLNEVVDEATEQQKQQLADELGNLSDGESGTSPQTE